MEDEREFEIIMSYLGGYTLPYDYPLQLEVRFDSVNRLTNWGNYATGKVILNGHIVATMIYGSKEECNQAMIKAKQIGSFLSDQSLDALSQQEYDYLFDSKEFQNVSLLFSLSESCFEQLIETRKIAKAYIHDSRRADNDGWFTGVPHQYYNIKKIEFDGFNTVTVVYHLDHQNFQTKVIRVSSYFRNCLLFAYKLKYLIDLTNNSGCFGNSYSMACCFPREANAWLPWNAKQKLVEFGYGIVRS